MVLLGSLQTTCPSLNHSPGLRDSISQWPGFSFEHTMRSRAVEADHSNHTHWEWGRGASPRKTGVLLPEEMGRWSWMGRINLCVLNNNKQQSYLVGCCSLDWMLMLISHASLNAFYMGHGDQCKIRWSCWKAWEAHWPLHPNNSPVCSFQLLSFGESSPSNRNSPISCSLVSASQQPLLKGEEKNLLPPDRPPAQVYFCSFA